MSLSIPWIQPGANQAKQTEKEWSRQIVGDSAIFGWVRHYHNLYAVGSDSGYPDLTLIHPEHGVLWLELKGGTRSTIYVRQIDWIEDLQAAGLHAYIAKPKDYDAVQHLLRGNVDRPRHGARGLVTIGDYDPKVWDLLKYQDRSGAK